MGPVLSEYVQCSRLIVAKWNHPRFSIYVWFHRLLFIYFKLKRILLSLTIERYLWTISLLLHTKKIRVELTWLNRPVQDHPHHLMLPDDQEGFEVGSSCQGQDPIYCKIGRPLICHTLAVVNFGFMMCVCLSSVPSCVCF